MAILPAVGLMWGLVFLAGVARLERRVKPRIAIFALPALLGSSLGCSSSPSSTSPASSGPPPISDAAAPPDLPSKCSGSCDGVTPNAPMPFDGGAFGNVTSYSTQPSTTGACEYGATSVMYYAAMSLNLSPGDGKGQWEDGRICGDCAEVTVVTSEGLKSVLVRIMDECPDNNCGIDLGGSAGAAIMVDGDGRYQGEWQFVSCKGHAEVSDGPPALYVKDGSNPYWAMVQVRNPNAAVSSIQWTDMANKTNTGTLTYPGSSVAANYFQVPTSVLQGNSAYVLTLAFSDGSTSTVQVTSAQLGAAMSSYPLQ